MPALRDNFDAYLGTIQENTRGAREDGVTLVVGSDAPPGVGTHLEIELLADTGLAPREAGLRRTSAVRSVR